MVGPSNMAHSAFEHVRQALLSATNEEEAARVAQTDIPQLEPEQVLGLLALAVERRRDAACAALLAAVPSTGFLPVSFEELAGADMPAAAVALARLEAGAPDLADATCDSTGDGYLHAAAAAAGAGERVVQALAAAGCRPGQRNADGDGPLHLAAAAGHLETCRVLVAVGADPLARNGKGRTPRQQAGSSAGVREYLAEAEEATRRQKREREEAVWGAALAGTQSANACLAGCV